MTVLGSGLRRVLESGCVVGRGVSEGACRVVLGSLGVVDDRVPSHLVEADRVLRRGLRAKSRQLGDADGSIELLVAECAFEQWHRLLFARFLAENGLLMHPQYKAPVSLAECGELAAELGEPDGWAVAGRFAAQILPGIFRLDDPCVQLRLAAEGRLELERIVSDLPVEVFTADDSLGWVYQYWQKVKKDEVNASERKIGGADLGPVTQLFTENYMVRFLLENSLGAWWAARYPTSLLVKGWEFLRFDDDGVPAAGSFEGWPARVAEVTVMDPCCGSGHFLVEAFSMLWQMRAEEEGLSAVQAQDAVLRDNLFGLELDPRCVQIAMFAVALTAWKAGGGWRELPVPHVACSGIPVKAPVDEWKALARGDQRLENALGRLHVLFRDADTLGSLIDPRRAVEGVGQLSSDDVDWDEIEPLLTRALTQETADPATAVLGADAAGIARAAHYLARQYTLIATNVPYLVRGRQSEALVAGTARFGRSASSDLATAFVVRSTEMAPYGMAASVSPANWLTLGSYQDFRRGMLATAAPALVAWLGSRAFQSISGEVVNVVLTLLHSASGDDNFYGVDASPAAYGVKAETIRTADLARLSRSQVLSDPVGNPDARLTPRVLNSGRLLLEFVELRQGLSTGDYPRFIQSFWEQPGFSTSWVPFRVATGSTKAWAGCTDSLRWENGRGALYRFAECHKAVRGSRHLQGQDLWGKQGVMLSQMSLTASLFGGTHYADTTSAMVPRDNELLPALWCFVSSDNYRALVREVDLSLKVPAATLAKVPFDVEYWRQVAAELFPDGLPVPWSDDATQWLFEGRPEVATEPLQVGVGRLLGFCWPEQLESDDLDDLADGDGIVCLPSVLGERPASDRLQGLLARAFGDAWSPARAVELLTASGSKKKDLESWLREDFFKAHCQVFKNRPFVWHVWDGRKDGFAALVNYHRLDRTNLERLTFTYLGDWIERQTAGVREDVAGAEERLAAAQGLQRKLQLILDGEPPYDIFVRWKSLAEQPLGWEPDLNDGVRLNVRPFVEAGVLRSSFNVKWDKDRGKNPDGSERHNDLHYTRTIKETARKGVNT